MMHGPHHPPVEDMLAALPDRLRRPVDFGLRSVMPENYMLGLRLLLAIGPERFAAVQHRSVENY